MDRRTPKQIEEIFLCYLLLMPKRKQTAAANKLGIRKQYFNNYYNGLYRPPDELLVVMEDFLFVNGVQLKTIKQLRHFTPELEL